MARISPEDLPLVAPFKWTALEHKDRGLWYACRRTPHPERKLLLLHRVVMGAALDQKVDHADGNGLNCVRGNLRFCTTQQNAWNTPKRRGVHQYKGTYYDSRVVGSRRWGARIRPNNRTVFLGLHETEEDAARAWDTAARSLYGEFARLNFQENQGG